MKAPGTLGMCNCFAVRQAARRITRLYEHHLAGVGLTIAQFSILAVLHEAEQRTMAELAKVMVMDRTTLVRAMQPLQREQLVRSTASEGDPRQLVFLLSPAGERRLKQAVPLWEKAQGEFEAKLGTREAARLRTSLLALGEGN